MTRPDTRDWLWPDWHPHPAIRTCVTTRQGEHSPAPWQGFNLGLNCHDRPERVQHAREHLQRRLGLNHIGWLTQVHGTDIVTITPASALLSADASLCRQTNIACAILTADCLPVLFARQDGTAVAAAHAGWRGLAAGILRQTAKRLAPNGEALSAWLGPAICQRCYQVGEDVYRAFLQQDLHHENAFIADGPGHFRLSLTTAATQQLTSLGIAVTASGLCTSCHNTQFYSYRKEHGKTGRFASLIWLAQ